MSAGLETMSPNTSDHSALMRELEAQRFAGYAYSYPHKSAYRAFDPPLELGAIWRQESNPSTGLYLHIPFCEMRCGFCNLFTSANPKDGVVEAFLVALKRQLSAVRSQVGARQYASFTIGGGTPTYLSAQQLDDVLANVAGTLGLRAGCVPLHVETSPATATRDRLAVLVEHGVRRISIGAQSFDQREVRALGRPQRSDELVAALDEIRRWQLECLNIDLIYGVTGQTEASFERSIAKALQWQPEEVFLYPLYVRCKTGLDGRVSVEDQHRLSLYRHGRSYLLDRGYRQVSMRMFRKMDAQLARGSADGEAGHSDQPLLGIGCGARSRTTALHYASRYAVSRAGVSDILNDYCRAERQQHAIAEFGVALGASERKRRAIVRNVLVSDGLDVTWFERAFGESPENTAPHLVGLEKLGLLDRADGRLTPTALGFEYADAIGPLIYSPEVTARMQEFVPS